MNWVLNLIGIFGYFLGRYSKRKNKTKLSGRFWISDNWVELVQTLLLNITLMLIINMNGVSFDIAKYVGQYLPVDITIAQDVTKAAMSAALGWFLTAFIYNIIKSKTKKR